MKRKSIILISLIVFILILILYKMRLVNGIDNSVYNLISNLKSDSMTSFMKFITFFASTKFIVMCMIVLLFISFKYKKIPIIFNFIIIVEVLINSLVKVLVKRSRPTLINLVIEKSYSFPSGHTMIAITFYGFIIYLLYKYNIKYKKTISMFLVLLIILILISRIYLGVHYFTDIVGGISLALAYLLSVTILLERKKFIC